MLHNATKIKESGEVMNSIEKEKLKQEILEELRTEKSRKEVPGLVAVKKKWFNGADRKYIWSDSSMDALFGNDQHRVWDNVRQLTRVVFNAPHQTSLLTLNQEEVAQVADILCKIISDLRIAILVGGKSWTN